MSPELLYTVCVLGAASLLLMLRPGRRAVRLAGVALGVAVLAWLLVKLPAAAAGDAARPELFFTLFSLIAVASAVRMITHSRPVYAALYFILVVLSTAALFLLMSAEFMAFALIIVYAGAILITYLFVLMLAQQQPPARALAGPPEYDRVPREPVAASLAGFLMLAMFSSMVLRVGDVQPPPSVADLRRIQWMELEQLDAGFRAGLEEVAPGLAPIRGEDGRFIQVHGDGSALVRGTLPGSSEVQEVALPESILLDNTQRVGYALVARFPVSLELAGVILTMAMFGAVVLARRQIELGEDEVREAAGLPRSMPKEEGDLEPEVAGTGHGGHGGGGAA